MVGALGAGQLRKGAVDALDAFLSRKSRNVANVLLVRLGFPEACLYLSFSLSLRMKRSLSCCRCLLGGGILLPLSFCEKKRANPAATFGGRRWMRKEAQNPDLAVVFTLVRCLEMGCVWGEGEGGGGS